MPIKAIGIEDIFSTALASDNGIRVKFATRVEAKRWRLRAYKCRAKLDREAQALGLAGHEFMSLILSLDENDILIQHEKELELEEIT